MIFNFSVGDTISPKVDIWNPLIARYYRKGKKIIVESLDDLLFLPSPEKWTKI